MTPRSGSNILQEGEKLGGSGVCQRLAETGTLEGCGECHRPLSKLLPFSEPQLPHLQNGTVTPTLQGCCVE